MMENIATNTTNTDSRMTVRRPAGAVCFQLPSTAPTPLTKLLAQTYEDEPKVAIKNSS